MGKDSTSIYLSMWRDITRVYWRVSLNAHPENRHSLAVIMSRGPRLLGAAVSGNGLTCQIVLSQTVRMDYTCIDIGSFLLQEQSALRLCLSGFRETIPKTEQRGFTSRM